jgi:uncharacterized membrane protein HdeD (DUF308 family)
MRASDDLTPAYPHVRMRAVLIANWWAMALRGVFAILFGLLALLVPGATISVLVLLYAAYMLADGILAIVAAVRAASHRERWRLLVLEGIVDIIAGLVAFVWPTITVLVFVFLLAVWAVVTGALLLGAAFRLDAYHGRWWMALGGVLSIVWGVLLFLAPAAGAVVLTWWLGAYSLLFGILLLVLAFQLRARRGTVAGAG